MDWFIVLSTVLSIVAVIVSVITLWLAELRGPDISLLSDPRFELSDENFVESQIRQYTPRWLTLRSVPLVFANYGGKAGTILDLEIDFIPTGLFKSFCERFYFDRVLREKPDSPISSVIIEGGDNECLEITLRIVAIEWKEMALAEVLDRNLPFEDMIEKAWESSKDKFRRFCSFLEESSELGKISCTATLTKGRFRTRVARTKLFKDVPVRIHLDGAVPLLRDCLSRWEDQSPTKAELRNELRNDVERLMRELKGHRKTLDIEIGDQNISSSSLRTESWRQINQVSPRYERKIRWFLIGYEAGLKEDLTTLYDHIVDYNRSISSLSSRGEFRTPKHFKDVNAARQKLCSSVEEMINRLSSLYSRHIS